MQTGAYASFIGYKSELNDAKINHFLTHSVKLESKHLALKKRERVTLNSKGLAINRMMIDLYLTLESIYLEVSHIWL